MAMTENDDGSVSPGQSLEDVRAALLAAEEAGDVALARVLRDVLSDRADDAASEAPKRSKRGE